MNTATPVRRLTDWRGDVVLYRVDPPVVIRSYDDKGDLIEGEADHVIVSAVFAFDTERPETYLFAADAEGEPLSMAELPGSFRGGLDHGEALRRVGYEVR